MGLKVYVRGAAVMTAWMTFMSFGPVAHSQAPQGQPAQGQAGQAPQGRGGGGNGRGSQPLKYDDYSGFTSIFTGTMKNWDGDPSIWKAEGDVLVGTTTAEKPLTQNTFVIWRGGKPADFELKVEFRMSATNSGIQFRSTQVPAGGEGKTAIGQWVLKGYQADIDFANQYTGMIYEERGRMIIMQRGQMVEIGADSVSRVIGNLQRNPDELKALIKPGEWNNVHLIARGNIITNIVNGQVMSMLVDDDVKNRSMKGLLGFQIHVGPPMKIEFRNVYLKNL